MMNDQMDTRDAEYGKGMDVGDRHYRAWVGPPDYYDLVGAVQFNMMTSMGLREYHCLLDGCGSLRGGRLFIVYLMPGHYYGIEPEEWVLDDGISAQLGSEMVRMKRPTFSNDGNFTLSTFDRTFDFILAHSVFTHASQSQIERCLSEARRVMSVNSIFLGTFDESGTDNYQGDEWVYPGIAEYTREFMAGKVQEAGLEAHFLSARHPWGQTWIAITDLAGGADIRALQMGLQFDAMSYLTAHKPEERNERIRTLTTNAD